MPRSLLAASFTQGPAPAYARSVVRRIIASTRNLAEFPLSGRKVPEFDDEEIREVIVQSYRVIYRVRADEVVVAAVVHGRRDVGK